MPDQVPPASIVSSTSRAHAPSTQAWAAKKRLTSLFMDIPACCQRVGKHRHEQRLNFAGLYRVIVKRNALAHVQVLAHLQLHGVYLIWRRAVMPGDVAALESAIEHMADRTD